MYWQLSLLIIFTVDDVFSQEGMPSKCGLPGETASLPDYAQEELRNLWRSYIQGTPCDRELAVQQNVLSLVDTFNTDFTKRKTKSNSNDSHYVPAATIPAEYEDELTMTTDDMPTLNFGIANAPFLRFVPTRVRRRFEEVWDDVDIPSESLRMAKIQTLAVSLLTAKQLEDYNQWVTKRRYVLKSREQELRHLSFNAKQTLRRMSSQYSDASRFSVSPAVKSELRNFLAEYSRRRSKFRE